MFSCKDSAAQSDIGEIRFSIYTQTLLSLNYNKLRSFSDFIEECTEKAKSSAKAHSLNDRINWKKGTSKNILSELHIKTIKNN